jgi:gamma-glutamyltranspeptidase/glutathione hydrolase
VVSISADASAVGRDVLMHGGNAVDAAVATAFALAVTFPEAGNIAGGGFMIVRPAGRDATPLVIDYRETAPAAATLDLLAGPEPLNQYTMVGVPGTVRGLALAHQRFGHRPWRELIQPAIALAERGFVLNQDGADSLNKALDRPGEESAEMRRVLGKPGGGKWVAGDRLVQPQLAATLRRIADEGPDGFYRGEIADAIVQTVRAGGGIVTADDLANYRAKFREPIHGTFRGYDVYAPPPPTSGGITLIEMLNILERFDLAKQGRWSPRTLHLMIEAMRRAYADRARSLGDSDFVSIPPQLTSKDYAATLASQIDPDRATPSESLARDIPISQSEGDHTTHFSVLDAGGMAVSNTYTLEQPYGSRIIVPGYGFLLNNEMGDFNRRPGVTDRTGRIGTVPNTIAPGKRMLSSIAPTIVTKSGRVVMVTGSPGGRTIINTLLCVLLNRLEFGMSPRETIDAPRMSHTWLPDEIAVEGGMSSEHADAVSALRAMGHCVIEKSAPGQGDAHSLFVEEDGTIVGVADQRRGGTSAGY